MTTNNRARALVARLLETASNHKPLRTLQKMLTKMVVEEMRTVMAEVREQCAQEVEGSDYGTDPCEALQTAAAKLRALS